MTRQSLSRAFPALLLVGALCCAVLWPSVAHPQDDGRGGADERFEQYRERFQGTWELAVSRQQARRTVDRAIDRAVGAMNLLIRQIARPQLVDNTPINQTIALQFLSRDRIRVRFDTGWEATTRVGRTSRARSQDGDEMRVTQRFRDDGSLEQVFQTDQGTRWNVYTSTGEGRMRAAATTQGMMMPQPMHFSLDYRRR